MDHITDKVWLVTGSSSGFGNAICRKVLESGGRVVATARNVSHIAHWEQEFREHCRVMEMDVTAPDLEVRVASAAEMFGGIDVLVNNAGYGLVGALEECSMEQIRLSMETLYFGPMRIMKTLLPWMRGRGGGTILNISAAAAITNYPGFSAYGAGKAALEFASESIQAEAKAHGIRVLLIEPGPFRTGFISHCMEVGEHPLEAYDGTVGRFRQLLKRMDGKQVGDPERAAALMVDLVERGHAGLRVPLGRYAVKKAKDRAANLLREVEMVESEASATDYAS